MQVKEQHLSYEKKLLSLPLFLDIICAACLCQSPAIADTPVTVDAHIVSLTVDGDVYFSASSSIIYETNSSAASAVAADLTVVTGDIDIEAGVAIEFSDLAQTPSAFAPGTIFTLVNYGGNCELGVSVHFLSFFDILSAQALTQHARTRLKKLVETSISSAGSFP
jgi:hypothetical protein